MRYLLTAILLVGLAVPASAGPIRNMIHRIHDHRHPKPAAVQPPTIQTIAYTGPQVLTTSPQTFPLTPCSSGRCPNK